MKFFLNCFLIFLISSITSCDNKNEALPINVIPLESAVGKYQILNLSDYSTEIKYIPLETNESALLGTITQLIYENEKIFIKSISGDLVYHCYLFDNSGMFSRKIGQPGQGPDDYLSLNGTESLFENFIYLMDTRQHKLLTYDTTGLLVNNVKLRINEISEKNREHYSIHQVFPLKKDIFVMNVASSYGHYPKAVLLEAGQSDLKTIKEYTNHVKLDKQLGYSFVEGGVMYRFGDNMRIYKALNDTIFTIDQNTEMKDAFIFELGKYRFPLSLVERRDSGDDFDNYIIPSDIFESSNHLFINFNTGIYTHEPFEKTSKRGWKYMNKNTYGVFDKFTGELILMGQPIKGKLGFKNDLDNGPVIWPHYISSNNELVTYISAEDFLEYYSKIENPTPQMTEIAKNVKPDDNEIVIVVKLKEKSHNFAD